MQRSRREEYTEATRRALLDSAAEAFVDRGFAGAPLDDIAQSARLTKGALYHHFASQQALFRALFEEGGGEVIAAVSRAARGAPAPRQGPLAAGPGREAARGDAERLLVELLSGLRTDR